MIPNLPLLLFLSLIASVLPAVRAQSVISDDALIPYVRPPGITRLQIATDLQNGFVPPEPAGRVRVPPLETVWLLAPQNWPYALQWTKNGALIAGATQTPLVLREVNASDSGVYSLAVVGSAPPGQVPIIATRVQIDVVPDGHFGNFSARVVLSAGNDVQMVGYVVDGRSAKRLLIRAVGPSLKQFGVANSASEPRFRLYKSDGTEYSVIRPAVVYPPAYWAALFRQAGAFALTAEAEAAHIAYDTFDLPPGAYSVHVSDDSAKGGQVLVEVYEFDFYPPLVGLD